MQIDNTPQKCSAEWMSVIICTNLHVISTSFDIFDHSSGERKFDVCVLKIR